jgi:hypothetical protein
MRFGAGPEPDPANSVAQLMKKLSENDIKNNLIRILDDGTLVVTPYKEVSKSDNTSDLLWKDSTYPTKEFLMGKHTYSEDPNFVNTLKIYRT